VSRSRWILMSILLLAAVMSVPLLPKADAAPVLPLVTPITGAWYVDTVGAPFVPHGITFHDDGTLDLTNPDAAEATNSSSAGMGSWTWIPLINGARGRFFEVNADKTTNMFTSILIVTFEFRVTGNTFTGPATARYYDGNQNLIAGPFPATLKGQRFTVDGPVPDPI
jgi:hypothetical protein